VIEQAKAVLRSKGRITYRTLKRQFALDDEALEDLKEELIEGERVAVEEGGKVLVWKGDTASTEGVSPAGEETPPPPPAQPQAPEGERRQLTVPCPGRLEGRGSVRRGL